MLDWRLSGPPSAWRLSLTFLLVYLVLEAFGLSAWWLLANPASPYKALWLGLLMTASFFMAPALWLVALETSTNRQPSPTNLSPIEWLVMGVGALLTLPLILSTHSGTLMVDPARSEIRTFLMPYIHETMLACVALFLIQVPFYLRKSINLVKQHKEWDFGLFSNIDHMPLNTLRVLIWLMAGNWLLTLIRTSGAFFLDGPTLLDPLLTCVKGGITLWALTVILKRAVLSSVEKTQFSKILVPREGSEHSKYARSALDATAQRRIERKLKLALEEDNIFTRSNLNLRELCNHLQENTHYVSQVINQSLDTSFYELINSYRIQAAKQLLVEKPDTSVLDIALEVGFNSKSPFNLAFKKATGVTPREYRKASKSLAMETQ